MADKTFVGGFRTFAKKQTQPDFVIGDLVIDIALFKDFINNNQSLLTDYNGNKQLKCQITMGRNGAPSISVNDYKHQQQPAQQSNKSTGWDPKEDTSSLPF